MKKQMMRMIKDDCEVIPILVYIIGCVFAMAIAFYTCDPSALTACVMYVVFGGIIANVAYSALYTYTRYGNRKSKEEP